MPSNLLDASDIAVQVLLSISSHIELPDVSSYEFHGKLTVRQRRYRAAKLTDLVEAYGRETQITLLQFLLSRILSDPLIETLFDKYEIELPDILLPKHFIVSRKAKELTSEFLTLKGSDSDNYITAKKYIIEVAKQTKLSINNHGDIEKLSQATSCSFRFAKKVLEGIDCGKETGILGRDVRCDSIKATDWPDKIYSHVLENPQNTRAVPGQDKVSVRYGVRREKYLLLKSRDQIAKDFKELYPECPFSISTIKREFPQNAVTPTSRDLERNSCPVHANARRMVRALHNAGAAKDISKSCRIMSSLVMCEAETVDFSDPLTWREDCAMRTCKNCPNIATEDPLLGEKTIMFSQWGLEWSDEKGKKVYGLNPRSKTVNATLLNLSESLPALCKHIYVAHHQWQAHKSARENLQEGSVITVEDYQQNLEVVYNEAPTSMAYSSNKLTVAIYPVCVEFISPETKKLEKGAITFISKDKKHDYMQVQAFEKRMFEIIRGKEIKIDNWERYSDSCTGQFRSRKCNAFLLNAPKTFKLEKASFEYFEANEGKNVSDSIGSIVKCAFQRGISKLDEGVKTASDIVQVINNETKDATPKFKFFIVEEFGEIEHIETDIEYPLPGIRSIHSLKLFGHGIIASTLSCLNCTAASLCATCKEKPLAVEGENSEEEEDLAVEPTREDEDDLNDSDRDGTDESESDSECFSPGDIVWAKYQRTYFPAKVVTPSEVPVQLHKTLFRSLQDSVVVRWYGESNFSRIKIANVDPLAENKVDSSRAAKNNTIFMNYQLALADLRKD